MWSKLGKSYPKNCWISKSGQISVEVSISIYCLFMMRIWNFTVLILFDTPGFLKIKTLAVGSWNRKPVSALPGISQHHWKKGSLITIFIEVYTYMLPLDRSLLITNINHYLSLNQPPLATRTISLFLCHGAKEKHTRLVSYGRIRSISKKGNGINAMERVWKFW